MTASIEQAQKFLEQRLAEFEMQLSGIKENPEDRKVEVLSRDFYEFKTFAVEMFTLLRKQIAEHKSALEELEVKIRSDSLLLRGFPEKPGEKLCQTVIEVLQDKLNISEITPQSIRLCHRLGRRVDGVTRSILVSFYDHRLRNQVWNNKVKFKGTLFSCTEFLTKSRQMLFTEARLVFGVRNCWTQNGQVMVKLPNGSKRKVNIISELETLASSLKDLSTTAVNTKPAPVQTVQQGRQRRVVVKK